MQVYGFLENSQLENVAVDKPSTLSGLIWFNTASSRAKFYDSTAVRTIVDENSVQTVTGKILTGNRIANLSPDGTEVITFPVKTGSVFLDQDVFSFIDAAHQTTPAAPAVGNVRIYSKDDNLLYKQDSEGNEVAIGTGGGGLDVFHTEDFEVNNAADLSSGNSANFLGGGVPAGTLEDEIVNPISKGRSLKYTQAAGSLNDYVASPVIDIDLKQAGNDFGYTKHFTYTGNEGDIKAVLFDATNNEVISDELDLLTSESNPTRFSISAFIPQGVTQIRWGFQVVVENVGAVLLIDDIEMSVNPFVYKNLIKSLYLEASGNAGQSITANVTDIPFIEVADTFDSWDGDSFTARHTGNYVISGGIEQTPANSAFIYAWVNGVQKYLLRSATSTDIKNFSGTLRLNAGDVLTIRADQGFTLLNNPRHHLNITAEIESPHVVTPVKNRVNTFTARISNNGTATLISESSPFIQSVSRTSLGNIQITFIPDTFAVTPAAFAIVEGRNGRETTINPSPSVNSVVVVTTDGGAEEDNNISLKIDRQGVDVKEAQLTSAIPQRRIAHLVDAKPSGVQGGTFNGGVDNTRDITELRGDKSFLNLSSNQFSFTQAGEYFLSGPGASAQRVDTHRAFIYDTTAAARLTDVDGNSVSGTTAFTQSGGDFAITRSSFSVNIRISESQVGNLMELRHFAVNGRLTVGFGEATNNGDEEIYSHLTIEKLR
jgi:hypothetical protein